MEIIIMSSYNLAAHHFEPCIQMKVSHKNSPEPNKTFGGFTLWRYLKRYSF